MSDRAQRVTRLTDAARRRAIDAEAASQRAITSLHARGLEVSFASVAREAKVSLSYLYKTDVLASRIRHLRGENQVQRAPRPDRSAAERALETKLAAALEQIHSLQKENEQLKKENRSLLSRVLDIP